MFVFLEATVMSLPKEHCVPMESAHTRALTMGTTVFLHSSWSHGTGPWEDEIVVRSPWYGPRLCFKSSLDLSDSRGYKRLDPINFSKKPDSVL